MCIVLFIRTYVHNRMYNEYDYIVPPPEWYPNLHQHLDKINFPF